MGTRKLACPRCGRATKAYFEARLIARNSNDRGLPLRYRCEHCKEDVWQVEIDSIGRPPRELLQVSAYFREREGYEPVKTQVIKRSWESICEVAQSYGLPIPLLIEAYHAIYGSFKLLPYGAVSEKFLRDARDLVHVDGHRQHIRYNEDEVQTILARWNPEELGIFETISISPHDIEDASLRLWRGTLRTTKVKDQILLVEPDGRLIKETHNAFLEISPETKIPKGVIKVKRECRDALARQIEDVKVNKSQARWVIHPHMTVKDSVAAHSNSASILAFAAASFLRDVGISINPERCITLLTIHDLYEARGGDMPGTATDRNETERGTKLLNQMTRSVSESYFRLMSDAYKEFEENKTIEARISQIADKVDGLLQVLLNSQYDQFTSLVENHLTILERLTDRCEEARLAYDFLFEGLIQAHPSMSEFLRQKRQSARQSKRGNAANQTDSVD